MRTFRELNHCEKYYYVGNILYSLGALAISIGTVIRLAAEGKLPSSVKSAPNDPSKDTNIAKDYFS